MPFSVPNVHDLENTGVVLGPVGAEYFRRNDEALGDPLSLAFTET